MPLGPIIGTNLLHPFLTTIDGPEYRLLLSDRTDLDARSRHLAQLPDPAAVVRYGLWDEHRVIALADIGSLSDVALFIDTGLVSVTPDQGQAAVLALLRSLRAWSVAGPRPGSIAGLPRVGLGHLGRQHLTALSVSTRTWHRFGD